MPQASRFVAYEPKDVCFDFIFVIAATLIQTYFEGCVILFPSEGENIRSEVSPERKNIQPSLSIKFSG